MLNVLKNSILIVLFALVSSSGIPAQGQNLTLEEAHVAHEFYRNETCEAATIPPVTLFSRKLRTFTRLLAPGPGLQITPGPLLPAKERQKQHGSHTRQTQPLLSPLLNPRKDQILRLCPAGNHCLAGNQTSYRAGRSPCKLQSRICNLPHFSL